MQPNGNHRQMLELKLTKSFKMNGRRQWKCRPRSQAMSVQCSGSWVREHWMNSLRTSRSNARQDTILGTGNLSSFQLNGDSKKWIRISKEKKWIFVRNGLVSLFGCSSRWLLFAVIIGIVVTMVFVVDRPFRRIQGAGERGRRTQKIRRRLAPFIYFECA